MERTNSILSETEEMTFRCNDVLVLDLVINLPLEIPVPNFDSEMQKKSNSSAVGLSFKIIKPSSPLA